MFISVFATFMVIGITIMFVGFIRDVYTWNRGVSRKTGKPWKPYSHAYPASYERWYGDEVHLMCLEYPFIEKLFPPKHS